MWKAGSCGERKAWSYVGGGSHNHAMADQTFTLGDGRRIGVSTHGNPAASRVVIFCHPAPGSGVFDPDPTLSETSNAHILALDRPGYGSSDPLPQGEWPSVARAADDIAEFLHERSGPGMSFGESAERHVSAVGWSAGGRVALALAARHPQLVGRVAVIGTPAPNDAVEWIPKPLAEQSEALSHLPAGQAFEALMGAFAQQAEIQGFQPTDPPPLAMLGIRDVDDDVLQRPGVQQRLERMLADSVQQGPIGQVTDLLAYTAHPWGFDVADVKAETLLVYGTADQIGPEHGEWYASQLANTRRHDIDGVGHLVVVPAWERVLEFLTEGDESSAR